MQTRDKHFMTILLGYQHPDLKQMSGYLLTPKRHWDIL
jgi:hypothetical protein